LIPTLHSPVTAAAAAATHHLNAPIASFVFAASFIKESRTPPKGQRWLLAFTAFGSVCLFALVVSDYSSVF
jgi:uncharacterized membrane protein YfcA